MGVGLGLLCRPGGQGLFCLSLAALGLQGFLAGLLVGLGGPLHPGHEARCQVAEAVMSLRPVKGGPRPRRARRGRLGGDRHGPPGG